MTIKMIDLKNLGAASCLVWSLQCIMVLYLDLCNKLKPNSKSIYYNVLCDRLLHWMHQTSLKMNTVCNSPSSKETMLVSHLLLILILVIINNIIINTNLSVSNKTYRTDFLGT